MRLDKYIRRNIALAAEKALREASDRPEFSYGNAVSMFEEWHYVWMPDAVKEVWNNPVVRNFMAYESSYVVFGPLSVTRRHNSHVMPEVTRLCEFNDVFEPIIEQLDEGKRVREKQWRDSRCPDTVKTWLIDYYKLHRARAAAMNEVQNALASCTTVASLIQKWPALTDYVPAKTPNLPAVVPSNLSTFTALMEKH